jgi:uncharacterized membrane protein YedE/YeeE
MVDLVDVILILFIHFVADFLLQSREMATNKSKSLYWLSAHVIVYSVITGIGWSIFINPPSFGFDPFLFIVGLTFITHWVTDFCTSKLTTYFYTKEKYFEFFGVIGLDQLIHTITLLLTYQYLFN